MEKVMTALLSKKEIIYKIALQNLTGIGLQKIDRFQIEIQRPSKRKTLISSYQTN